MAAITPRLAAIATVAEGARRMNRRIWGIGLVVLGGIGWYVFRPELLLVNKKVNEELAMVPASGRRMLP
jgi:hypothetical protein